MADDIFLAALFEDVDYVGFETGKGGGGFVICLEAICSDW